MLTKGQKITNYTIDSDTHIGKGNFSYVYKAIDENNQKIVALKICKVGINTSDIKRFYRENEILYKLHFPESYKRIIKPYSKIINDSNYCCYIMEFASCNLEDYLNEEYERLSINDKLEMFKKICEGIAYAHKKKVVHRDLWWNNVLMVCNNNVDEPKLCDFGRAKNFDEQEEQYNPHGLGGCEVIYPPENLFNIWGEAKLDDYVYADIYALGIILVFIIRSKPIFFHDVIISNFRQFKANEELENLLLLSINERNNYYYKWLDQLDIDSIISNNLGINLTEQVMEKRVNAIIHKLCYPDYRKRYNSVDLLLEDLNNL